MPEGISLHKLAFIGAGQMGEALIGGFLGSGLVGSNSVWATDPSAERRELLTRRFGVRVGSDNEEAAAWADVVLLAVKPHTLPRVLDGLASPLAGKLVISVAAGVSLERIGARLPSDVRLIRVMPNAPALLGEGMSALTLGAGATADDASLARTLFETAGRVVVVRESLMHAVTGLSGSGPAYAFVMIEALADGGVKMGLPRDVAVTLASRAMFGAAKMWLDARRHPGCLEDRVAAPDGTTSAGLRELERGGLRAVLGAAVEAATAQSRVLGGPCS